MFKKMLAAVLCAVMAVSCFSISAGAQEVLTATVAEKDFAVTATRWNGKAELKAGKTYAVTSNVTISEKVVIPSGTTLIVMKNAKLWVSSKGSLYIKGRLNVRGGGTLAVTGALYQYKGKILMNYGEIRFSGKSKVTLNGKTTVYSTGSVTGTPGKLSVGVNADIVCKGENSCKKLDLYIDRTAIETRLDNCFTKAIQKSDIYGAMKAVMNAEYLADLDKALAGTGTTFEQLCEEFGDEYRLTLGEQNIDPKNVKSVTVTIIDMDEVQPEGDMATVAQAYYAGADKCCKAACRVTVKTDADTYTEEAEVTVIRDGGKWYLLG